MTYTKAAMGVKDEPPPISIVFDNSMAVAANGYNKACFRQVLGHSLKMVLEI